jgi:hypothetical protein
MPIGNALKRGLFRSFFPDYHCILENLLNMISAKTDTVPTNSNIWSWVIFYWAQQGTSPSGKICPTLNKKLPVQQSMNFRMSSLKMD